MARVTAEGRQKRRSRYLPVVEALEALRLLSLGAPNLLPGLTVPQEVGGEAQQPGPAVPLDAWDTALAQAQGQLSGLIGSTPSPVNQQSAQSGLVQLDRYLNRAWYRAGIPPQQHDDCSQAVYVTLLQNLGRSKFDQLLGQVGTSGIRDVLSRETPEGPDFFRAVDTVKKRAQRERTFQPLDEKADLVSNTGAGSLSNEWRGALQEAIDQSLSPREAALIYATIKGETPQEIASQWGVAPKTISNEKTRVIQKLREFLVTTAPE
jgi:RNA polymerase sigma factor (sigma-70 family)